ncbi:hypothetical protein RQP54_11735 [Curvibacter sp. APW13]|uniref:hypothetical protein n=1 Tax=Curvibacter sp. APW13 TaxID=3077236 RepID=UPI0028DEF636|nr:hypothetical protein [Curvibacter sp. APW13]MDT8991532.1 hypothetical protein [Curvibacter sp. APW13]
MNPDVWNLFHDGTISNLSGDIPGDVWVLIEIGYLRAMFPGHGNGFSVLLRACSTLEFEEYDKQPISEFTQIVEREPEILACEPVGPTLEITCTLGTIRIVYAEEQVFLEDGTLISPEELAAASARYWEEWKRSWQSPP